MQRVKQRKTTAWPVSLSAAVKVLSVSAMTGEQTVSLPASEYKLQLNRCRIQAKKGTEAVKSRKKRGRRRKKEDGGS
jgi:hypothetical protein